MQSQLASVSSEHLLRRESIFEQLKNILHNLNAFAAELDHS